MMRTLLALLMALCLPLQGLGHAVSNVTAPAHYHAGVAAHDHDHAGVTAVGPRLGPLIGHHTHALEDDDVVYVADAHDTPSHGGGGAKTPPLDGVLQGDGWLVPPSTSVERAFAPAAGVSFSSHVGGPLRRPPRRSALR